MTQAPNNEKNSSNDLLKLEDRERQGESPQGGKTPERKNWSLKKKVLLGAGIVSLLGIGSAVGGGWYFIQNMLSPMLEKELSDYFNRPVKIGPVQKYGWGTVTFGSTQIPATPTDPDWVKAESVNVTFDPQQFIQKRQLNLDVVLVKPTVYIEQDEQKKWVSTKLDSSSGKESAIAIDVNTIKLQNSNLSLVGRAVSGKLNPVVKAILPAAEARLLKENNQDVIKFNVFGNLLKGGQFKVEGKALPKTEDIDLNVNAAQLDGKELANLLTLPMTIQDGSVSGQLGVKLSAAPAPLLNGTITLEDITAKVPELAQAFAKSNGNLKFIGSKIEFNKVKTNFGQVPGTVDGYLNMKGGYAIKAETSPVSVSKILNTLKLKQPRFPIAGELKSKIQVTGLLAKPKVNFDLETVKASKIDKIDFKKILANLELQGSTLKIVNFIGTPNIGGLFTGKGQMQLGTKSDLAIDFQANNVPGKDVANLYGAKLDIDIGAVSGKLKIVGPADKLDKVKATGGSAVFPVAGGIVDVSNIQYKDGKWQAKVKASGVKLSQLPLNDNKVVVKNKAKSTPTTTKKDSDRNKTKAKIKQLRNKLQKKLSQSKPQTQASIDGQFNVTGRIDALRANAINVTGTAEVNLANGRVTANKVELSEGNWSANLQLKSLEVAKLAENTPNHLQGSITGNLQVSGNLEKSSLDNIDVSGSGNIALPGGKIVTAKKLQLAEGKWQATLQASNLPLKSLSPKIPKELAGTLKEGTFNVSGNVKELSREKIALKGKGKIAVAGGTVITNNLEVVNGEWIANINTNNLAIASLAPKIPDQLAGTLLNGNFQLAGKIDNLELEAIDATGSGKLALAGGKVTANNVVLSQGQFQADLLPENVVLKTITKDNSLEGLIAGNLNLVGNLDNLTLPGMQAKGELVFSEGLTNWIERPIATDVIWDGKRLEIAQANGSGVSLSGFFDIKPEFFSSGEDKLTQIEQFRLDIREAKGLNLQTVPFLKAAREKGILTTGWADFTGTVAGNFQAPEVQGSLGVNNLEVIPVQFESAMLGNVTVNPQQGVDLQLSGNRDEIKLSLNPNYQPLSFFLNTMMS
jgi:translocation and assembly module TamB